MGYGHMGDMMGAGPLWVLVVIIVLGALAAGVLTLVIYAVSRPREGAALGDSGAHASVDGAAEILRRRYAAGEIDEDEFTRRSVFIGWH